MGSKGCLPGVKLPGREVDHSPPSGAKVKNARSCTSTTHTPSWRGAQLKHRNFTLLMDVKGCGLDSTALE